MRSAVVVLRNGHVAMIRRDHLNEDPYYLFPGGGVEEGETPEQAAVREAYEELGLRVRVDKLLAVVSYGGREQHYYLADVIDGQFGAGAGSEMASPLASESGTYTPIWLAVSDLHSYDVRPKNIVMLLNSGAFADVSLPLWVTERRRERGKP